MAEEKTINVSNVQAEINKLGRALEPQQINNAIGRHITNIVKAHLFKYNADHQNSLGGRRTNYFSQAAKATSYQESGQGVTISIKQVGMALQYYGGTVTPGKGTSTATGKPTQFLTIPAIAEAHGKSAFEIPDLVPVFGSGGRVYGLAKKSEGRKKMRGMLYFWLVKSATIKPHPDVIPSDDTIRTEVITAVKDLVKRNL